MELSLQPETSHLSGAGSGDCAVGSHATDLGCIELFSAQRTDRVVLFRSFILFIPRLYSKVRKNFYRSFRTLLQCCCSQPLRNDYTCGRGGWIFSAENMSEQSELETVDGRVSAFYFKYCGGSSSVIYSDGLALAALFLWNTLAVQMVDIINRFFTASYVPVALMPLLVLGIRIVTEKKIKIQNPGTLFLILTLLVSVCFHLYFHKFKSERYFGDSAFCILLLAAVSISWVFLKYRERTRIGIWAGRVIICFILSISLASAIKLFRKERDVSEAYKNVGETLRLQLRGALNPYILCENSHMLHYLYYGGFSSSEYPRYDGFSSFTGLESLISSGVESHDVIAILFFSEESKIRGKAILERVVPEADISEFILENPRHPHFRGWMVKIDNSSAATFGVTENDPQLVDVLRLPIVWRENFSRIRLRGRPERNERALLADTPYYLPEEWSWPVMPYGSPGHFRLDAAGLHLEAQWPAALEYGYQMPLPKAALSRLYCRMSGEKNSRMTVWFREFDENGRALPLKKKSSFYVLRTGEFIGLHELSGEGFFHPSTRAFSIRLEITGSITIHDIILYGPKSPDTEGEN